MIRTIYNRIVEFFRDKDGSGSIPSKEEMKSLTRQYVRQNQLRELVLNMVLYHPQPFWVKSEDGKMVLVNEAYEKAYKKYLEDYAGNYDKELWGEQIAKEFGENDAVVRRTKSPILVVEKLGEELNEHLLVIKYPITDSSGQEHVAGEAISVQDVICTFADHYGKEKCLEFINQCLDSKE